MSYSEKMLTNSPSKLIYVVSLNFLRVMERQGEHFCADLPFYSHGLFLPQLKTDISYRPAMHGVQPKVALEFFVGSRRCLL